MTRSEQWEQIRAACELLHDLATAQVERDNHPLAKTAAQWLDHVGAVAAWEGGPALRGVVHALPPSGVLQ